MTREPSRREVLAALSAVGAAGAVTAGTGAVARDVESLSASFAAGTLDVELGWLSTRDGAVTSSQPARDSAAAWYADAPGFGREDLVDDPGPVVHLDDLEPGDEGHLSLAVAEFGNCAWLWLGGAVAGDLADHVQADLFYDEDCDGGLGDADVRIASGTLTDLFGDGGDLSAGVLLDGDRNPGEHNTADDCTRLGKIERTDGGFEAEDGTTLSPTAFRFDTGDGPVTVELTQLHYKGSGDDREIVGFDARTSGGGLCRVDVKGGPDTVTYGPADLGGDCVTAASDLYAPTNPGGKQAAVSNATFYACDPGDDPEPNCFAPGEVHCLGLRWRLPKPLPPDAEGTSAEFGVTLAASQRRHDDPDNPFDG
jgi:hypothetical protein